MSSAEQPESGDPPDSWGSAAVIILTAGRGTRMRSSIPKVLHPLAGLPMIDHVVRTASSTNPAQIILTVGPSSRELVDRYDSSFLCAWQEEPLGTGDAVAVALPLLDPGIEWVVVIYGDHPLLDAGTLSRLMQSAASHQPIVALLAIELDDPGPYGRYRYRDGRIVGTVEAHEDTDAYNGPVLVNSGMCCYRREWLESHIRKLPLSPKGEYYLTRLVEMAADTPWPVDPVLPVVAPPEIAVGINDRVELATAERLIRERINQTHMRAGVTMVDPATTYVDVDVSIGADTYMDPGCILRGRTIIGERCRLGPGTVIEDTVVGDEVVIISSTIEHASIGAGVHIGPYSHLRPGAVISPSVHIGNFVEIKNASVGSATHIGHFSYVGDARLGTHVNIGAGTVTCNFDGRDKHHTEIGDDVFVGSDSMLVAPVALGAGSRTGAGSVVTHSVPAGTTVMGVPARPHPTRAQAPPGEQE